MSNQFIRLSTVPDFLKYVDFLMEGFRSIKENPAIKCADTETQFVQTVLDAITQAPSEGFVVLLCTGKGVPLAYIVCINNTLRFKPRTVFTYATYSNDKCSTAVKDLLEHTLRWAKENEYTEIQAGTRRITGAARRWFEQKYGFSLYAVLYTRKI